MNIENTILALKSKDELERCDAVEYLANNINQDKIADVLLTCFFDKNYLVRCEAYDAFYGYTKRNVLDILTKRLCSERSICARMHLCSTICSIIVLIGCNKQIENAIRNCYTKEKYIKVLISSWTILYFWEQDRVYLNKILDCLNNKDYHIRCNLINLLCDIECMNINDIIKPKYQERLIIEDSEAVRIMLKNEIERMDA